MARRIERKKKVTVVEERTAGLPATEVAKEKIGAATAATGNALASVAQTVGPAIDDARQRLAPVAEQAITRGKRGGRLAAVKLGVIEEPKETHKIRNLMMFLGLGALAAAAFKMMRGGEDADPAWISGRNTAAAPSAPVASDSLDGTSSVDPVVAEPAGSDPLTAEMAATGPLESTEPAPTAPLAAPETVESPVPTTPDEPLERRDLA